MRCVCRVVARVCAWHAHAITVRSKHGMRCCPATTTPPCCWATSDTTQTSPVARRLGCPIGGGRSCRSWPPPWSRSTTPPCRSTMPPRRLRQTGEESWRAGLLHGRFQKSTCLFPQSCCGAFRGLHNPGSDPYSLKQKTSCLAPPLIETPSVRHSLPPRPSPPPFGARSTFLHNMSSPPYKMTCFGPLLNIIILYDSATLSPKGYPVRHFFRTHSFEPILDPAKGAG